MTPKAVILGSNYFIALTLLRSLGPLGITCVAIDHTKKDAYAFKSKYVNEALVSPHYQKDPQAFLQFLIDYAQQQDTRPVLFPCADNYVEFIDQHLDVLNSHYAIAIQTPGLYTQVMNKDTLFKLALKHNMPVPPSLFSNDPQLFKKVQKEIGYPCIIKPVDSPAFSKTFYVKSFVVQDEPQLREGLAKAKAAKLEVIVQRIVPGFDDHMYTYDAYVNQHGKVSHWITCQKQRQYPINFGASTFTLQKYEPILHELGTPFLEAIGFKGFAEIEFKKDADTGQFYLIEVNVRTTTLNYMLMKAGINFAYVHMREMMGQPLMPQAIEQDTGYAFWFEYEDLLAMRAYRKAGQLSWRQMWPKDKVKLVPAVYDNEDLAPFFGMLGVLFRRFTRKIKRVITHAN
jgi:D-aspartate ligase